MPLTSRDEEERRKEEKEREKLGIDLVRSFDVIRNVKQKYPDPSLLERYQQAQEEKKRGRKKTTLYLVPRGNAPLQVVSGRSPIKTRSPGRGSGMRMVWRRTSSGGMTPAAPFAEGSWVAEDGDVFTQDVPLTGKPPSPVFQLKERASWNPVTSRRGAPRFEPLLPLLKSSHSGLMKGEGSEDQGHSSVTRSRSKMILNVVLPREDSPLEGKMRLCGRRIENHNQPVTAGSKPANHSTGRNAHRHWSVFGSAPSPPPPPPPSAPAQADGEFDQAEEEHFRMVEDDDMDDELADIEDDDGGTVSLDGDSDGGSASLYNEHHSEQEAPHHPEQEPHVPGGKPHQAQPEPHQSQPQRHESQEPHNRGQQPHRPQPERQHSQQEPQHVAAADTGVTALPPTHGPSSLARDAQQEDQKHSGAASNSATSEHPTKTEKKNADEKPVEVNAKEGDRDADGDNDDETFLTSILSHAEQSRGNRSPTGGSDKNNKNNSHTSTTNNQTNNNNTSSTSSKTKKLEPSPTSCRRAAHCDLMGPVLCPDCAVIQERRQFSVRQNIMFPQINVFPKHMVATQRIRDGRRPRGGFMGGANAGWGGAFRAGWSKSATTSRWPYVSVGQLDQVVTELDLCKRVGERSHRAN